MIAHIDRALSLPTITRTTFNFHVDLFYRYFIQELLNDPDRISSVQTGESQEPQLCSSGVATGAAAGAATILNRPEPPAPHPEHQLLGEESFAITQLPSGIQVRIFTYLPGNNLLSVACAGRSTKKLIIQSDAALFWPLLYRFWNSCEGDPVVEKKYTSMFGQRKWWRCKTHTRTLAQNSAQTTTRTLDLPWLGADVPDLEYVKELTYYASWRASHLDLKRTHITGPELSQLHWKQDIVGAGTIPRLFGLSGTTFFFEFAQSGEYLSPVFAHGAKPHWFVTPDNRVALDGHRWRFDCIPIICFAVKRTGDGGWRLTCAPFGEMMSYRMRAMLLE